MEVRSVSGVQHYKLMSWTACLGSATPFWMSAQEQGRPAAV